MAWHKHHHVREGSFWSVEKNNKHSWNWNSLLEYVLWQRDSSNVLLGMEKKLVFGLVIRLLIKLIGDDGARSCCIPLRSKVADACNETGWSLPSPRSDSSLLLLLLHIYLTSLSSMDDTYNWFVDGITWASLRPRSSEMSWYSATFLMWIAQLNRLPTCCLGNGDPYNLSSMFCF